MSMAWFSGLENNIGLHGYVEKLDVKEEVWVASVRSKQEHLSSECVAGGGLRWCKKTYALIFPLLTATCNFL